MLLVAGLAACNQIYGLDGTQVREVGIDAAPDLEDEDLDGIVNEFDNCPGLVNSDQRDIDLDTVGDVCDPGFGIEKIVGRYMFNRPRSDEDAWVGSGWRFEEGYIEQPTLGTSAMILTKQQPDGPVIIVEARITLTFDRANANRSGIVLEGFAGDLCILADAPSERGLYAFTTYGPSAASGAGITPTDGVPFTLRATSLRVPQPSTNALATQCQIGATRATNATEKKPPDAVGIRTDFNAMRVDHVVVYALTQ